MRGMDENPYKSPSATVAERPRKRFQFGLGSLLLVVAVVPMLTWLVQTETFWMALAEFTIIGGLMLILCLPLLLIGLVLEYVRRMP